MIVREEWDKYKLHGPIPYKYPLYLATPGLAETSPATIGDLQQLIFEPECDQDVYLLDVYIKVWDVPWRWKCQSCYYGSGNDRDIFRTDYVRREDLGEKGDRDHGGWSSPSYSQQDQMRQHAKQHQIMFSWARSLK